MQLKWCSNRGLQISQLANQVTRVFWVAAILELFPELEIKL